MYRHILIATDGSERSELALTDGIALASALGGRVTVLTVIVPLHTTDPKPVADIPGSADFVREYLHGRPPEISAAPDTLAADQGMVCDTVSVNHEHPYQAIIETAKARGVRPDRDGLARAARPCGPHPGQRDDQGADPQPHPGSRTPVSRRLKAGGTVQRAE